MRGKADLSRRALATIVGDLLELPQGRNTLKDKIVAAIFTSMRTALLRGERIYISGIGLFTPRLRPIKRRGITYFQGTPTKIVKTFPPKLYIKFVPEENLINSLNGVYECRSRPS